MTTTGDRPVAARVRNLTKTYGSGDAMVRALDDVSLDLVEGEFTAIMGPSGSGKSTLMHCCAALDNATSGEVWVGDRELSGLKDKELTRLRRDRIAPGAGRERERSQHHGNRSGLHRPLRTARRPADHRATGTKF